MGSTISAILTLILATLIIAYLLATKVAKRGLVMKLKSLPSAFLFNINLFVFLYSIILLIVYSFNNTQYSLLWHGFTLAWYKELFADSDLWLATWHSFFLGLSTATMPLLLVY